MRDIYSNLLTPSMRKILIGQAKSKQLPIYELTVQQARQHYEKASQVLEIPRRNMARVEIHHIIANDGYCIPIRLYAPSNLTLPVVIYLHGGGFVVGSINSHDQICRELSARANCAVIAVDYRLAPEYIFPTALEDCWQVLQQLALGTLAQSLNVQTEKIIVAGDSAGGTLATVLAIMARNAGMTLAGQILLYPGVTSYQDSASYQQYASGFILEKKFSQWAFEQYAAQENMRLDWRFAPLLCDDVTNVCATWVGLAECDPMFDEGIAYADHLRSQLVPLELEVYLGVTHEFIKMGSVLPQAKQALQDMAQFIRQKFY